MDCINMRLEEIEDAEFFNDMKHNIEKELSNMKKVVNGISELRVEVASLESNLVLTIDSSTWQQISDLTGLGTMGAKQDSLGSMRTKDSVETVGTKQGTDVTDGK